MTHFLNRLTVFWVLVIVGSHAQAQIYPNKSVRMVVGFPAGGGADTIGRIVAKNLTDSMKEQVIVDNRGGASGQIAAELVAKSTPDGYTLMLATVSTFAILPSLSSNLRFDALKDFEAITLIASGPNVLVVNPSVPAKNVKELIAVTKSKPGHFKYATPGAGTIQHIAAELFKIRTGVDILHVPYKGSGQSIVDLLGGQVDMDFDAIPVIINHVRSGRLRALAVTSVKRSALLPDIPTINESGIVDFNMSTWWGLVAPARVDKRIIDKLYRETAQAVQQPDAREKISFAGGEPAGNTPQEFSKYIRDEIKKYASIVKTANIRLD